MMFMHGVVQSPAELPPSKHFPVKFFILILSAVFDILHFNTDVLLLQDTEQSLLTSVVRSLKSISISLLSPQLTVRL